jgi:transcriptional regulator with XRE-family HTH domain
MPKRRKLTAEGVAVGLLRLLRGWNKSELAKASGIDKSSISRYERGFQLPSQPTLQRLCASVGVPFSLLRDLLPPLRRTLSAIDSGRGQDSPSEPLATRANDAEVLAQLGLLTGTKTSHTPQQARQEARELWDYLKGRPTKDRRVLVEGAREYKSWALCELLCSVSETEAANDAGQAVELAALAVRIAELVPEEEIRQGLQGYAWAYLGNARRVRGNLPAADEAFARSDRFLSAGAPGISGLLDTALLPDLKASLRHHQGRFEEALKLHEQALSLAKPEDHATVLLNKAKTLEEMELYDESIAMLRQAESLVNAQGKPRDLFALRFNIAIDLVHLERYREADGLIPQVQRLVARLGTRLDELRLRWLEGKVAAGLGRGDEALAAFSEVRAAFIEHGIAFDTALVTLELAMVHLELGHTGEVKTLAREMVRMFESQGGRREALAALRLFSRAAEQERATLELARRLLKYLCRAQHDPELRFDPSARSRDPVGARR